MIDVKKVRRIGDEKISNKIENEMTQFQGNFGQLRK